MKRTIRVLSIDGGGIRGIIPSLLLKEIEGLAQRPISHLFDLIVGTSTGGLIALALTLPGEQGGPVNDAKSLIGFYENQGKKIFHIPLWKRVESAWNLLDEKYPDKGIERILSDFFMETRLKDAITPVMIPAYEIEGRMPWFFRSSRAKVSESYDFPMRDVARAACAAPTYFSPKKLVSGNSSDYYSLIDGGVFANNPSMCAYVETRNMFPDRDDILLVSLGTGELTRRIEHEDAKDWGLAQWAHPILNVIFDGISDTVDYQLKEILQPPGRGKRYFRFQTRLDTGNDDLDDARDSNIRALKLEAMEMIDTHREDLDLLVKTLMKAEERS
jgi:patatin-like phospholipase/acyl hydrolase